ncbi:hypothetical protein [Methylomonas sp. DH-1]|uniref:hypothetical protein n=1 Tax=Methylomonas sp. (strain DH-1) TaxID=1727196 RepID=UPI0007C8FE7C|nr:hypothetical protein [Methylomonas sp. DH-1]ANE57094.1 hypothetical protein AYM39_19230 [Methylomonas sp. DH-1]
MEKHKALFLVLLSLCLSGFAVLSPQAVAATAEHRSDPAANPALQLPAAFSWRETVLSLAEHAERGASAAVRETLTSLQHWLDFGMQAGFFGWIGAPSLLEALPLQNPETALPGAAWLLLGGLLGVLSRKKRRLVA